MHIVTRNSSIDIDSSCTDFRSHWILSEHIFAIRCELYFLCHVSFVFVIVVAGKMWYALNCRDSIIDSILWDDAMDSNVTRAIAQRFQMNGIFCFCLFVPFHINQKVEAQLVFHAVTQRKSFVKNFVHFLFMQSVAYCNEMHNISIT